MDFLVWFLIFVNALKASVATGVIELRLVRYDVPSGRSAFDGGKCCEFAGVTGMSPICPSNECDPYLHICIQDAKHSGGCPLGEAVTGFTANTDHVTFADTIGHNRTSNPIIFHFNGGYGGVVMPMITVYDEDRSSGAARDDKIDYLQHVISRATDYNNSREHVVPVVMKGRVSTLQLEVNVRCDVDYYGDDCQRYCVPDTKSYCNATGQLVCRPDVPCDPLTSAGTTTTLAPFPDFRFPTVGRTSQASTKAPATKASTSSPTTVLITVPTTHLRIATSKEQITTPTLAPFPDFRFPTVGRPSPAPTIVPTTKTSTSSPTTVFTTILTTSSQMATVTNPRTTLTLAPFPDFRFPTAGRPSPGPESSSTSLSAKPTSSKGATLTFASPGPNISTPSSHSMMTTATKKMSASGSLYGSVQISKSKESDVNVLQSMVVSRLATALNVNTSCIQINITLIANTTDESIYEMFVFNTDSHHVIHETTLCHVVTSLCGNHFSAQSADKTSPDDDSNTAMIAGSVSGVVLLGALTAAMVVLYRRKCKRTKVADEDTDISI